MSQLVALFKSFLTEQRENNEDKYGRRFIYWRWGLILVKPK